MKRLVIALVSGCVLATGAAMASGFSVYEQSAKASGQAGAWVARADDAAANWYNPAAMTRLDGMQLQFGVNLITVGSDTDFTIADLFYVGAANQIVGAQAFNVGDKYNTVQNDTTPVHLYFTHKVNEKISWGIGINNPIGLISEWKDLPINLSHKRAELVTFVVNPNIAFQVSEAISLAVGFDYMYADVKEFSRVGVVPQVGLATTDLTGDGDDYGFNVAMHYVRDPWKFGLTYRGEFTPTIDGDLEVVANGTRLATLKGEADLGLPAQAAIGLAYTGLERWEFEFDVSWAGWSSFDKLEIKVQGDDDLILREDWDDTFAFRFGTAWKVADRHEVRFGALYDESPVPTNTLRPSIPDSDRTSVTVGYGFLGEKWSIDAYYMPLMFDEITAAGNPALKPGVSDDPDGVIDGKYSSFVHLLGATVNFRF